MGTSFCNFHLKHDDPQSVWMAVAEATSSGFYVARTPEAGWCSLYPQDSSDAHGLAKAASESLRTAALLFEVYDSDSCKIALFQAGRLLAKFANAYEDRLAKPGNVEKFAGYATGATPARIRSVLERQTVLAEETAFDMGAQFGLSTARIACDFAHVSRQSTDWLLLAQGVAPRPTRAKPRARRGLPPGFPEPGTAAFDQMLRDSENRQDREFYDTLGPERSGEPCRTAGCAKGAISFSVFCRSHHFESVRGRPSPFSD
jgi:hypothetical protein